MMEREGKSLLWVVSAHPCSKAAGAMAEMEPGDFGCKVRAYASFDNVAQLIWSSQQPHTQTGSSPEARSHADGRWAEPNA